MGLARTGAVFDDRYRLVEELGHGGMGSVWRAVDQKLQREVALKVVAARHAQNELSLRRFEREARSVAKLKSPHIVQVYDYGVFKKTPYMVMEVLSGESLSARLKRVGTMPLRDTARLGLQLGKALAAAHAAKVVHRDLKPGNIFLVREHDEDLAKVFDFGIAKALETIPPQRQLTEVGSLLGTPHYMAPEQVISATEAEPRSDAWSLAVILYRCSVGRIPFEGERVEEILGSILNDPPLLPSQIPGCALPLALDEFFAKALERDPQYRFDGALELANAFAEAAGFERRQVQLGDDDGEPTIDLPTASDGASAANDPSRSGQDGSTIDEVQIPMRRAPRSLRIGIAVALLALTALAISVALERDPSAVSIDTSATPSNEGPPMPAAAASTVSAASAPSAASALSALSAVSASAPHAVPITPSAASAPGSPDLPPKPAPPPKPGLFDAPF